LAVSRLAVSRLAVSRLASAAGIADTAAPDANRSVPIPPSAAEPLASTPQRILRWVERTPHALAFIEPAARYGYGDLGVGIAQWARALASCGVGPGRLVGVRHDQRYLHFLLVQACQVIGATSVSLSAADIASNDPILGRCQLLCVPDTGAPAQAGVLALSQAVIDQVARSPLTRDDLRMLDHCPAETDIVRLVKTSGTTGRPKVLAMTQGAMNRLLAKTLRFPDDPGHAWNVLNLYDFTLRSALMEAEIALRFGQTVVTTSMPTLLSDMRRFSAFRLTMVSGDAIRLAATLAPPLAATLPPDWKGPRAGLLSIKGGALPEATRTVLPRARGHACLCQLRRQRDPPHRNDRRGRDRPGRTRYVRPHHRRGRGRTAVRDGRGNRGYADAGGRLCVG
jgi:nonribosomal peptide synthetase DhbF